MQIVVFAESLCTKLQINSVGTVTTVVAGMKTMSLMSGDGGPALAATLYFPNALAVSTSGDVIIADTNHSAIRKVGAKIVLFCKYFQRWLAFSVF